MKIKNVRKISGLCYLEDVYSEDGIKVTRTMFDNNCKLIDDAKRYVARHLNC